MSSPQNLPFKVKMVQDVAVVHFNQPRYLEGDQIERLGMGLKDLVEQEGRTKVLVSLKGVEYFSSNTLEKLALLDKRVRSAGTRSLVLCDVAPEIYGVFTITGKDRQFKIVETEEEGLEQF